jgi:hypothetical protein
LSYSVGVFSSNRDYLKNDDVRPSLLLGAAYDFGNGFSAGVDYTTGKFAFNENDFPSKARGEFVIDAG